MKQLTKQIALLERVDQLIRLKATGAPKQLAERLEVSQATIFRIIETMKEMNAPVCYDISRQSYIYTEIAKFKCGFYVQDLDAHEERNLSGGANYKNLQVLSKF
ncbi:HTH domain-containing protein [uncultured Maribacter sp.]|uniref:HTH domain-containing protein n=1 Tax=uncultured Maribacter sp. TaxID=431308 RepID=UPI0030ECBE12|tara:strand:+ start:35139 stop:35450 length:312 start_codon:yes stop_codon:yes gene_type:complete